MDTCIYVAGLLRTYIGPERNVCPLLLQAFRLRQFRLQYYQHVDAELNLIFRDHETAGLYPVGEPRRMLESFLTQCDLAPVEHPSDDAIRRDFRRFWSLMKHGPGDPLIAVAVHANTPDFLVTTNANHWVHNPRRSGVDFAAELGIRGIYQPHEFCHEMGVPI